MVSKKIERQLKKETKPSDSTLIVTKVSEGTTTGRVNSSSALGEITKLSNHAFTRLESYDSIIGLFPEIKIAGEIISSAIISPKTGSENYLHYTLDDINLPVGVTMGVLKVIGETLNEKYKLDKKQSVIIEKTLIKSGSHIEVIIPENVVDAIINNDVVSLEDIQKNKALIQGGSSLSILSNEGLNDEDVFGDMVSFTDNIQALKLKSLVDKEVSYTIESRISGREIKDTSDASKINQFFKPPEINTKSETITQIEGSDSAVRRSFGSPLSMTIPSEAVVVVHSPGEPDNHVGYFVLLDETGSPVRRKTKSEETKFYESLNLNDQNSTANKILTRAKKQLVDSDNVNKESPLTIDVYRRYVEETLTKKLEGGLFKDGVSVSGISDIYKTMLSRHLSKKKTRVLFIPKEYVVYYATDYYENGIGKSLTDEIKTITSIRAMLLITRVRASIKNSTGSILVSAEIDPKDPDPEKTAEKIMAYSIEGLSTDLPIGIENIHDIVDWGAKLGIYFEFSGNDKLPSTKVDVSSKESNFVKPDTDLEEDLYKRTASAYGLTPDMISQGDSDELATVALLRNDLFNRRIKNYKSKFNEFNTLFVRKVVRFDEDIRDKIKTVLVLNKKDIKKQLKQTYNVKDNEINLENEEFLAGLIDYIATKTRVSLPKSDEVKLDNLTKEYGEFKDALEDAIEVWLSDEIVTDELHGSIAGDIDNIKKIIIAHYLRKWQGENNYFPELSEMVTRSKHGDAGINLSSILSEHTKSLLETIFANYKGLAKLKKQTDKKMEKIDVDDDDDEEATPAPTEGDETEDQDNDVDI